MLREDKSNLLAYLLTYLPASVVLPPKWPKYISVGTVRDYSTSNL